MSSAWERGHPAAVKDSQRSAKEPHVSPATAWRAGCRVPGRRCVHDFSPQRSFMNQPCCKTHSQVVSQSDQKLRCPSEEGRGKRQARTFLTLVTADAPRRRRRLPRVTWQVGETLRPGKRSPTYSAATDRRQCRHCSPRREEGDWFGMKRIGCGSPSADLRRRLRSVDVLCGVRISRLRVKNSANHSDSYFSLSFSFPPPAWAARLRR